MITLDTLQPYVRYVRELDFHTGMYSSALIPYDCRLFYIQHGSGRVRFACGDYPLTVGDLLIWPSGMKYCTIPEGDGTALRILAVNFDLTYEHSDNPFPIPPARVQLYAPERLYAAPEISELPMRQPIQLHQAYAIGRILQEMLAEYESARRWMRPLLSARMHELLIRVARQENPNMEPRIDKMLSYIRAHAAEPLTNDALGRRFGFHPNSLNRLFVQHTGFSLHQYLLNDRLRQAIVLLESTDLQISAIAEQVGFEDSGYFARLFREKIGCTPSAYRKGESKPPRFEASTETARLD